MINAVRDCGLVPDLVTPDYCMSLSYPHSATFAKHFDSRYRWGEARRGARFQAELPAFCLR